MDIDDQPDIFPDGAGPSSGLPRPSPSPSAGDKGGRRNLRRFLPTGRKGAMLNHDSFLLITNGAVMRWIKKLIELFQTYERFFTRSYLHS